ncbi:hypothetical protein DFH06DRAFT_1084269 [Mycena polygramma]|nr:hypothetical protein DFH06DRAFT_1084269 [Mycena polygramma]
MDLLSSVRDAFSEVKDAFSEVFSDGVFKSAPVGVLVVPCSSLDLAQRDTVLTTGLVIDAPLDPQTLEQTLSTTVERKFRRAGARLIPCVFTAATPAIAFTTERYHEKYLLHGRPDIRALANSSHSLPTIHAYPELRRYLVHKACPMTTGQFIQLNSPGLQVHVSVFDDLTLIGITSSQVMFDALGLGTLLHAWTRILAGEDMDSIPGMEWDLAPFEKFEGWTVMEGVRGQVYRDFRTFSLYDEPLVKVAISWVHEAMRDWENTQLIRVPKAFLEDKRLEIMEDLKRQGSEESVSTFDVLLAWWFKLGHSIQRNDDLLVPYVFIHIPVNLRSLNIFPGASTLTEPYINNGSSTIFVPPIPIDFFQAESLSDLASRIREATTAYKADLLILEHELRWRNENRQYRLLRYPADEETDLLANWYEARPSQLDFSAACVPRSDSEKNKKARVLFVLADMIMADTSASRRGSGGILMENESAIWMSQIKGRNFARAGGSIFGNILPFRLNELVHRIILFCGACNIY